MANTSGHVDTFARDNLPPREQWPEFKFDLPELQYPERLNCVTAMGRPLGRGRAGRPAVPALADRVADLRAAQRAGEPHRQCADPRSRHGAGQPRAAARRQQSDDGRGLFRRHQGRRRRGRDHAAACAPRSCPIRSPRRRSRSRCATRGSPTRWRRPRRSRPNSSASSIGAATAPDALETLMAKPGYEKFTACDTASDDVCLIAFTSGTTGEPKGTMHFHRDMLAICDSYAKHVLRAEPTDRFTGSPPLAFTFGLGGLVLFPLRIGASTVLLEKAGAGRTARRHRQVQDHHSVHRADRLSRHARQAQGLRHLVAPQMRVGRRDAAQGDLRRLACRDRHQDPRRHRRDRNAAHLHRLARARGARRLDRQAGAGLRGAHPRRRRQRGCRPAPSAASRCAGRPAAAISPTTARRNTCRTAGTSPATPT